MRRIGPGGGAAISPSGNAPSAPSFHHPSSSSFLRCGGLRLLPGVIDKPAYSAFTGSALASFLSDKGIITLVITGSETDVCVLATVRHAVDLGFRVVIVEDALCSSFDAGHDALMTLYRNRFAEQIELIKAEQSLWPDES